MPQADTTPTLPFVVPQDAPPAFRLPAVPTVRNLADLRRAMAELRWIESREQTLRAKESPRLGLLERQVRSLVAEIDSVRQQTAMQCCLDGVPFVERRRVLLDAIHTFADNGAPRAA